MGFFPSAYSMGISVEEFKRLNPKKLEYVKEGYKKRIQRMDALNWLNGKYTMQAVALAIEANFAKNPKGKYIEKPALFSIEEKEENTNKESNEEVAVFEMKQRIKLLQQQGLPESPD